MNSKYYLNGSIGYTLLVKNDVQILILADMHSDLHYCKNKTGVRAAAAAPKKIITSSTSQTFLVETFFFQQQKKTGVRTAQRAELICRAAAAAAEKNLRQTGENSLCQVIFF